MRNVWKCLRRPCKTFHTISKAKSFDDGAALFQADKDAGLEGIVSKRKGSSYQMDTRSRDWLKVKNYKCLNAIQSRLSA
ncbi:hypothetical protein V1498_17305 [Peribacillus sp. SCS-26]|uniref:ATP-dependent DNA ligase n=1 Tax=Paraperibacillus marinus TaxID=3115295 RepID=UPI003905B851